MITSFEVGAVFRIINEASPALRTIMRQIGDLRLAIDKAKASMAELAKMPSLAAATGEVNAFAEAWGRVAAESANAARAIGRANARAISGVAPGSGRVALTNRAAAAAAIPSAAPGSGRATPGAASTISHWGMFPTVATPRGAAPRPPGGGGGGGSGGNIPWYLNQPNAHYQAPSMPLGGMGHFRVGGPLAAAGAAVAYAGYQAAMYDDAAALMATHAGTRLSEHRDEYRKILEDASRRTGFGEHDVSMAAMDFLRQMKHTPGGGNGVPVMPTMFRVAGTEARLKNTSLEQAMAAETGLAHMVQQYKEEDVVKLAAAFSALSVNNPMSLEAQERAYGYAVPILKAGMDLDPIDTMAAGTALARAGIKSSRSGTWIREMMKGAMPGTSFMSKTRFHKHEKALKQLGLVDDNDNPTWFVDGKPNQMKFLEMVSENLPKIPIKDRMGVLEGLANTRGAGALAVLAEPAVRDQMLEIAQDAKSPENRNRMLNFLDTYRQDSTVQNARVTLQTFNTTMADLGDRVLPAVNHALNDFRNWLDAIRNAVSSAKSNDPAKAATDWGKLGGRAIEYAGIGGLGGWLVAGPPGAVVGAAGGAGLAAAQEMLPTPKGAADALADKVGNLLQQPGSLGPGERPGDAYERRIEKQEAEKKAQLNIPPINFNLLLDSELLAKAILNKLGDLGRYESNSPAYDGSQVYGP